MAENMKKVFLVEDEPLVRDELKYILDQYNLFSIVGEADNAFDAISAIHSLVPDIVFLDIKLGSVDGVTLAKKINDLGLDIKVVFITAFEDYALEGFELNAVDYVLKPFSKQRLDKTVERLFHDQPAQLKPMPAPPSPNTMAHTVKEAYCINSTLRELEQQLPAKDFLRTHKSYIVNISQIQEIIPWFNYTYKITLRHNGVEIPVSRSYIKKFKASFSCITHE